MHLWHQLFPQQHPAALLPTVKTLEAFSELVLSTVFPNGFPKEGKKKLSLSCSCFWWYLHSFASASKLFRICSVAAVVPRGSGCTPLPPIIYSQSFLFNLAPRVTANIVFLTNGVVLLWTYHKENIWKKLRELLDQETFIPTKCEEKNWTPEPTLPMASGIALVLQAHAQRTAGIPNARLLNWSSDRTFTRPQKDRLPYSPCCNTRFWFLMGQYNRDRAGHICILIKTRVQDCIIKGLKISDLDLNSPNLSKGKYINGVGGIFTLTKSDSNKRWNF